MVEPVPDIPWITESELSKRVEAFRRRFSDIAERARQQLEVPEHYFPIEHIVEFALRLDIVPVPGLYRRLGGAISGYLTSDKTAIYVDQECCEDRPETYRYTLAHEIAHLELHSEIWDAFSFAEVAEWVEQMQNMDEGAYSSMEWQANTFAGQLLVNPQHLVPIFREHLGKAKKKLGRYPARDPQTLFDICFEWMCREVAQEFYVHPVSIAVRADKGGLSDELGRELFEGNPGIVTRGRKEEW